MNTLVHTVLLGCGATAVMDAWGIARRPLLGWPAADYTLVGRWVGHMFRGRFRHAAITRADAVRGERALGWTVHYLTGIAFAVALVVLAGRDWLGRPEAGAALLVGVGSVASPFLLMQPAMGAGVAARRTSRPVQARVQSLVTHAIFGLGLYVAGWLLHRLPA